ncbi:MAG TPA: hypothetical protein VEQ85_15110 [Lacipirellulaceae bacterium]|nr:hypothetical protein [Lacipirellulaceae bacterium]
MDDAYVRELLRYHYHHAGRDETKAHEIYHDDAILEFPQSGERFVGKQTFLTWRAQYPAKLDFLIRRISGSGDFWMAEGLISYDGSPWMFTVKIMQFRGDKVAKEYVYVMDGFESPAWRGEWAERFDPFQALE